MNKKELKEQRRKLMVDELGLPEATVELKEIKEALIEQKNTGDSVKDLTDQIETMKKYSRKVSKLNEFVDDLKTIIEDSRGTDDVVKDLEVISGQLKEIEFPESVEARVDYSELSEELSPVINKLDSTCDRIGEIDIPDNIKAEIDVEKLSKALDKDVQKVEVQGEVKQAQKDPDVVNFTLDKDDNWSSVKIIYDDETTDIKIDRDINGNITKLTIN